MMIENSYTEFWDEIAERRKEQIENECKKGNHTWHHYYDFMGCCLCGEAESIPTAREYLDDN